MTVLNRPVQAQPNIKPEPIPAPPVRPASPDEELRVVFIAIGEPVMLGQKQFTSTIKAKEDNARFQFDDEHRRVWVFVTLRPGEELVGWVPYTNVSSVFFGLRKVATPEAKGAA